MTQEHQTLIERLWARVDRRNPDDCWEWQGCVKKDKANQPYGVFHVRPHTYRAHRVAFLAHHGRWPAKGLVVRHTCDNPRCCNPAHLIEGTQAQNVADAQRQGHYPSGDANVMRRPEVRAKNTGEGNPAAKLSTEQVTEIRRRAACDEPQRCIARAFGVSTGLVSMIVSGKRWKPSEEAA